jgi:hypothetical protein
MKRFLIAATAAALALPAAAGDVRGDADKVRIEAQHIRDWAHDFANEMQGSMAYMFSDRVGRGKVVKGAPYSAEVVTEMNQTLADGNVITHRTANRAYRDGEGRTRQDTYRDSELRSYYISDPVSGVSYTVLPGSKIAVAIPRVETHVEMRTAPRARPRAEPGKAPGDGNDSESERKIVVRTVDPDGEPGVREEVRVQVIRVDDGETKVVRVAPTPAVPPSPPAPAIAPLPPLPPIPAIPGVHTMRFESTARLGKGVTASLGTREFDGVKAEGKQTTWTIPAGQIGNKNAINVTSETWYSPELQVTVYNRHNDPRTGESVYRLAAIKRGEPAADLFKVPEDYKMKGRAKREERIEKREERREERR